MSLRHLLAMLLLTTAAAYGQTAEPLVHADRTVTFQLTAPNATRVALVLEGTKMPLPMEHGAGTTGKNAITWTVTTPALDPEYYSYHFTVDGVTQLDAKNPSVKASYLGVGNAFLVPGSPARAWEEAAVPHGTVHHHTYTTAVVTGLDSNQSEFFVYTPPGYDARGKEKYPVLTLLHGWSDTAGGWASIGHEPEILDNLIAQGKAKPMIVVMPLGYGKMSFVRSGFSVWNSPELIDANTALFTQALLTEVLPQVERLYNTAPGRLNHAIAGLSMGGLEAVSVGLTHTDQFAYVAGFSAAVHTYTAPVLSPKTANLKLLYLGAGTDEDLLGANRKLAANLRAQGFTVMTNEFPHGLHTWQPWRQDLVNVVPLLFR